MMSVTTEAATNELQAADVPCERIWRLSVEQYHRMIRAGILGEDDPVELLDGWLVVKMIKTPPHSVATELTRDALAGLLPAAWHVRSQEPITLERSEPEPDVSVVRGDRRDYRERHPGPGDIALVVEVADVSLKRDRTTKKRVYAAAGIAAYWIVNLIDRCVEVYTEPTGAATEPDYRKQQVCGEGDSVAVLVDGKETARVAVEELLP